MRNCDPIKVIGGIVKFNAIANTVENTCRWGFKTISGDSSRRCLNSGEWSGTPLICSSKLFEYKK